MPQIGYSLAFARDMIPAKMKPYSAALPPIYEKFRGGYLGIGATGRGVEPLAGDWGDRSIMLGQFPDAEAVSAFWWSPEYRAAAKLREGAVRVDVCKLAGATPRATDRIFLIAAFRPSGDDDAEWLMKKITAAISGHANVLVAAPPSEVELLEGDDLTGSGVLILGYGSEAELALGWTALCPTLEAHTLSVQAYRLARVSPQT
jgi:uncharacterized protein (DUF1330 family)